MVGKRKKYFDRLGNLGKHESSGSDGREDERRDMYEQDFVRVVG